MVEISTSELGSEIMERHVTAKSIANNAGQLFCSRIGLAGYENRVEQYIVDTKSTIKLILKRFQEVVISLELENMSE